MAEYGSNFVQGAGTGALAGSAAGPWGALAGGVVGGVAGLIGAYEQEQDENKRKALLRRLEKEYNLTQDKVDELIAEYYANPENFLGSAEDVAAWKEAIGSYDPNSFVYDFDPYSYDKQVEDFLTPYYDDVIDATSAKVQHSAAGAGVGRGTGAANAIAEATARKSDELYRTALQQYNMDKQQSYQEWSGNIQAMQNRLNQLKGATDSKIGNLATLANDYAQQRQNKFSDEIAAQQGRAGGNLQLGSLGLMI